MASSVEQELSSYRVEIMGFLEQMYGFHKSNDFPNILRSLSAISSRVSWIRGRVMMHPNNKDCMNLKNHAIDPCLKEVDRQYEIYSRLITLDQFRFRMAGG